MIVYNNPIALTHIMLLPRFEGLILALLTLGLYGVLPVVIVRGDSNTFPEHMAYNTRRSHYPEYCSTLQHMQQRHIPPLATSTSQMTGETRLVHVTTVIRHGARTPWSADLHCWDGFWTSPETGVWDCNLTTVMAQDQVLFDKRYDALLFPQTNALNGTCQMGQLLSQGHEQQLYNGKILREAYLYNEESAHDERMRLLDVSLQEEHLPWEYLHFRSDDDQRTVMSGQVLLRSLLDEEMTQYYQLTRQHPTIALHIADRDRDIVDANPYDCPRLTDIQQAAMQSPDFRRFDTSEQTQQIQQYLQDTLHMGPETRGSILDCLMTTMCTDRTLPDAIDDYDGSQNGWFTKAAEYDIETYTKLMKYNASEFAKVALGPLWYEIMRNMNRFLLESEIDSTAAPKFALFAGHDTTIMPLLASLGPNLWNDTDWAPYASMLVMELHQLVDDHGPSDPTMFTSNFALRLLYNGKILTPLLEGCPPNLELCDVVHFKALVDPIATRNTDCASQLRLVPPSHTWLSFSTTTGMAIIVTLVVLSGLLGSFLTLVIMKSRFLRYAGRTKIDHDIEDSGGDDDYGLEMKEEDFCNEPAYGKEHVFVNHGNGHHS
jgi:hypothetical protein